VKHIERKTYETDVVMKVTCDICGREGQMSDWPVEGGTGYETNETKVYFKTGTAYPEGGSGVEYDVDVCPKCFTERLIPWLRSQGAAVRKTEWDF